MEGGREDCPDTIRVSVYSPPFSVQNRNLEMGAPARASAGFFPRGRAILICGGHIREPHTFLNLLFLEFKFFNDCYIGDFEGAESYEIYFI